MSFAAPVMLIVGLLGLLTFTSYIPGLLEMSSQGMLHVANFLAVFGSGKPFQGVITLGITVSIAGILLDLLNFYRYQSLRDRDFG